MEDSAHPGLDSLRTLPLAAICLAAIVLVGCGGESDLSAGSAAVSAPTAPVPPVDPNAQYAIQSSPAPATYPAGSPKDLIYKDLSQVRGTTFGHLHQNAALDAAAQAHANYLVNNLADGHTEKPGTPGFTGATVSERLAAAGFSGIATELIHGYNYQFSADAPSYFAKAVATTIYHGEAMLSPYREVGIGVARDSVYTQDIVVIMPGTRAGQTSQLPAAGTIKSYPLDNQTNLNPIFYISGEIPRPLPELSTSGHPVFFSIANVAEVRTLPAEITVHTASIRDDSGNTVPILLMTAPGVQVGSALATIHRPDALLATCNVYLVPAAPLASLATYVVSVQLTTPRATYSKTWSFKTGQRQ